MLLSGYYYPTGRVDALLTAPVAGGRVRGHALFEHAQLLAELLEPHTDVRIVLSTSWVVEFGLAEAVRRLPSALGTRVIGATFNPAVHGAGFRAVARGNQVQAEARRLGLANWIALDDDARDWPEEDLDRLIRTDPVLGLGAADVQAKLRSWLGVSP